jgi:hypothetical protein
MPTPRYHVALNPALAGAALSALVQPTGQHVLSRTLPSNLQANVTVIFELHPVCLSSPGLAWGVPGSPDCLINSSLCYLLLTGAHFLVQKEKGRGGELL